VLDREERPGEVARAVARAQEGDDDAMRYLYLRFADNVYGYACSILRDEHDAEDVTQQVFTRMMTALGSYQQRSVPFSAWLLRITHNMAIDHMRRRIPICEDPDLTAGDERCGERVEDLTLAIRDALAEVPAPQREVVILRHIGGYSPGEIAERLGRTEDAVHGLHHRGRRAMQAALTRAGAGPVAA
jgi:RNA polymerase sigma-70 factor (ECF subfamily)